MANTCNGCGLCCKLFLINLNREEYQSGKFKTMFEQFGHIDDFKLARESGVNFLAKKENGECIYLDGQDCSIHADRPAVCRDFFCTSKAEKFKTMVKIIKEADKEKNSSVLQIKA